MDARDTGNLAALADQARVTASVESELPSVFRHLR
jgi:hypothetical protein